MTHPLTINTLVDIYNTFCKALYDGKEVRGVFCDISNAFGRVYCSNLSKPALGQLVFSG